MNILITGAHGQLGSVFRELITKHKPYGHNFFFTSKTTDESAGITELDVCDFIDVSKFVKDNKIGMIINCAAYTNVDKAEDDYKTAYKLNVDAPKNLASIMKSVDGWLIHFSTDYVFSENDMALPLEEQWADYTTRCEYGATKFRGEKEIASVTDKFMIIRTSWLYSKYGNNFVKKMMQLFSEKEEIKVVNDQTGTPTYANDLARFVLEKVIDDPKSGVFHYSNEGSCTWYDFACEIKNILGGTICKIKSCRTNDYPAKAPRPKYSVLDKRKVKETYKIEIPHWTVSLKECLSIMKSEQDDTVRRESYGEKLRNLLCPYKLLVDIIANYQQGKMEDDVFNYYMSSGFDTEEYSKNIDRMVNLSKHEIMETNFIKDFEKL